MKKYIIETKYGVWVGDRFAPKCAAFQPKFYKTASAAKAMLTRLVRRGVVYAENVIVREV